MRLMGQGFVGFLKIGTTIKTSGVGKGTGQDQHQLEPVIRVHGHRLYGRDAEQPRNRAALAGGDQKLAGAKTQLPPFQIVDVAANIPSERFGQDVGSVESFAGREHCNRRRRRFFQRRHDGVQRV